MNSKRIFDYIGELSFMFTEIIIQKIKDPIFVKPGCGYAFYTVMSLVPYTKNLVLTKLIVVIIS